MLRSVVLAVDGSASGDAATELAIRWTKRYGSKLVGLGFVDEPGIRDHYYSGRPPLPMSLYEESLEKTRHEVKDLLELFELRCTRDNVSPRIEVREGSPVDELLFESQRHDVILVGRCASIRYGSAGDPLTDIVKHAPRPVVAVPEAVSVGDAVLVAYDGSTQAARSLEAFWGSGLWRDHPVTVTCVHSNRQEAMRRVQCAVDYLQSHDIQADPHPIVSSGSVVEPLLEKAGELGAAFLVMGAYGRPSLREFLFGSVTSKVLETATIPVFLYH